MLFNVPLNHLHSMALRAKAPELYRITSRDQLVELWEAGVFQQDPVLLGGGTNTIFLSDTKRPVLKMETRGIRIVRENQNAVWVSFEAGEPWQDLVTWAVVQQYGGIENLAGIPGSAGAAPVQNIGAYGVELSDVFEELDVFSTRHGTFETMGKEACQFGYRSSLFKRGSSGSIICSVTLRLSRQKHNLQTDYAPLQKLLQDQNIHNPGIGDIYKAVSQIRASKLPDPVTLPNSGSFFKNPVLTEKKYSECLQKYPEMPGYNRLDGRVKVPAAWLIEQTGWKGRRKGPVGTYEKHALVVVHHGEGRGQDLKNLMKDILQAVEEKFDIRLETEVHLIDDDASALPLPHPHSHPYS